MLHRTATIHFILKKILLIFNHNFRLFGLQKKEDFLMVDHFLGKKNQNRVSFRDFGFRYEIVLV